MYTVSSIRSKDQLLSSAATLDQSGPGSNDNEGALHSPQISKAGASLLDGLISYLGHSLGVEVLPLCIDAVGVFHSSIRRKENVIRRPKWNS